MNVEIDSVTSFPFPAVDFKFVNRGLAAAMIWKVSIEVCSAKVDVTPALSFEGKIEDKALIIYGFDDGWSEKCKLDLTVANPVLTSALGEESLRFHGSLTPGEKTKLLVLSSKPDEFSLERLQAVAEENPYKFGGRTVKASNSAVPLGEVRVVGRCQNESAQSDFNEHVWIDSPEYVVHLTQDGFINYQTGLMVSYERNLSFDAYVSIVDLTPSQKGKGKAPYEKSYSISRETAPGGTERFHIVVGATKSCDLTVRFKFYVDRKDVVVSEPIELKIKRSRSGDIPRSIHDGAEFINSEGKWVLPDQRSWFSVP